MPDVNGVVHNVQLAGAFVITGYVEQRSADFAEGQRGADGREAEDYPADCAAAFCVNEW